MGASASSSVVGGVASALGRLPLPVLLLVVLPALLMALTAVGLYLLAKLPRPVPFRWEVRLFLLMGMPADQYLAFVIKVRCGRGGTHAAMVGCGGACVSCMCWRVLGAKAALGFGGGCLPCLENYPNG